MDIEPTTSSSTCQLLARPADRVLVANQPLTTKAGKPRQRMQWTEELNTDLMRCYYKVTESERITIGIRPLLHREFTELHPELGHLSEQRLMDQKRVIIINNRLSRELLETIKREVTHTLQAPAQAQADSETSNEEPNVLAMPPTEEKFPDSSRLSTAREDDLVDKIRHAFYAALAEFNGTDPVKRPPIPKQGSTKKLAITINLLDTEVLPQHLEEHNTFDDLHTAVYVAAVAATRVNGREIQLGRRTLTNKHSVLPWERRLNSKVDKLRKDLGRLTAYQKGQRSKKLERQIEAIRQSTRVHASHNPENESLPEVIDTLRQKLSAISKRLKRYKESNIRKTSNKLFQNNEKQFYRGLRSDKAVTNNKLPTQHQVEEFWKSVWSAPADHNAGASWICDEENRTQQLQSMKSTPISADEVAQVIKDSFNWKAAGADRIQNFWYKRLKCTHRHIVFHFNRFLQNPHLVPRYLSQGISYLLPKDSNTEDPAKYRPITCLPTIYKLLTACIAKKIYEFAEHNNILSNEQKGCIKKSQGCKEQLLIDSVIMEQAIHKQRNLFTAFVDYRKAFDSVPHSWLLRVLQIYKVAPSITNLLRHLMSQWSTQLIINNGNDTITTDFIYIQRGIFQGDSLSPLWFCLSLNPLSNLLNIGNHGFAIKHQGEIKYKVTHLMYMDDIKVYASTSTHINSLLKTVEIFSRDIRMGFGLDKCRTHTFTKDKHSATGFELQDGNIFKSLEEREAYKYLGISQSARIEHKIMKERTKNAYINRLKLILLSKLNAKNTVKAVNTYAIPVLTYTFGIIKWTQTDLDSIERKTRTILTKFRAHHPKSGIERLTIPRAQGGRGFIDLTYLHQQQVVGLQKYFLSKQETSLLHNAVILADNGYTALNLCSGAPQTYNNTKTERVAAKINSWKQKAIHGRHPYELSAEGIDQEASNYWLTHGDLFPETEGFFVSIQDQVVPTKNYLKYVIKDRNVTDDRCRRCFRVAETIQHITAGCITLSSTEYLHRHNCIGKIIHQKLAQLYQLIEGTRPYYQYTPESVMENERCRLYWDRAVLTDRTIPANRPDIICVDKNKKKTYLIDIAVPNSNNIQDTVQNKLAKYSDLAYEIKQQWKQENVVVVPIVISTTAVVPQSLTKNLPALGLSPYLVHDIQKSVILNTCHIVRKFLNMQ